MFLPQSGVVIVAAVVAGILAGLATACLKRGIDWIGHLLTSGMAPDAYNLRLLVYPLAGIIMACVYQWLIKEDLSHGTAQLKKRVVKKDYFFSRSHLVSPLVGCFLTIGFGGSAGGEGPSAFSGAAIGDRMSRLFGLSPGDARILFGCGAAAGIAGIFKSPLGGIFFAFEVLGIGMDVIGFLALACASLASFTVVYSLSGFRWNISILTCQTFDPSQLGWVVLLGVVCGLYSMYYRSTQKFADRHFSGINNRWIRGLAGGAALSLMIFLFPSMFGEGYGVVEKIIDGEDVAVLRFSPLFNVFGKEAMVTGCVIAVLLLKGMAVGITNSSGGVAGDFAPTLFAGCLVGYLFGMAVNAWFDPTCTPESFALLGMAAVLAGAVRAPLMSIFLTAEISGRYNYILGLTVAVAVTYIVVWAFGGGCPSFSRNSARTRQDRS